MSYRFEIGEKVRLLFDIKSDGTTFGSKRGNLIQRQGAIGYIKKQDFLLEREVYNVHFLETSQVIGCREHELIDGDLAWEAPLFQIRDKIKAAIDVTYEGDVIIQQETRGTVTGVRYHLEHGYIYEVRFLKDPKKLMVLMKHQITSSKSKDEVA